MLKRKLLLLAAMLIVSVVSRAQSVSWNDRIMSPLGVIEAKLETASAIYWLRMILRTE